VALQKTNDVRFVASGPLVRVLNASLLRLAERQSPSFRAADA
jgi:hypothetical protein